MRFNLVFTSGLVSLLAGIIIWALQPDHKAFSWVEATTLEYIVGLLPGQTVSGPGAMPAVSMLDYQPALDSLQENVPGPFSVYASWGGLGRRIMLEDGTDHPVFFESWTSQGYYAGRRVQAQYGRLPNEDGTPEIVLGARLARQLFDEPRQAVGQSVELRDSFGSERLLIVGVLEPSPAQNPEVDVDDGLIGSISYSMIGKEYLFRHQPLFLQLDFSSRADADHFKAEIEAWVREYFGPEGSLISTEELFTDDRSAYMTRLKRDIGARRNTFIGFGLTLVASALAALFAQGHFHLLRRRQLLGVEKALGATRSQLAIQLIATQLAWTGLGGLLGCAALWALHDLLPGLFLTRPPQPVLAVGLGLPVVALLILAIITSLPLIMQSAMALLRGRIRGQRIRTLLWLVYGGLALAIAGGLAAAQVYLQVQAEETMLQTQFGATYALQASAAIIDTRLERAFEDGSQLAPIFTEADAIAVTSIPGVLAATLAQTLPNLGVRSDSASLHVRAAAADSRYLQFMGLSLLAGSASGCVVGEVVSRRLGITIGETITLAGLDGPIPCTVSGIMQQPPELWSWLVVDLPEIITPPLDGLGLALPGYDAQPFRSIRILLKLASPAVEDSVRAWREAQFPGIPAEVIPYTPDVTELLANLRIQAQMFLLIALLAAALSIWGIVAGFIALLEAERFRLALDRAFGLSVKRMAFEWWAQTLGLGALSALVGAGLGYAFAVRLYNAFALDIPNLPGRGMLALSPPLLTGIAAALVLLSASLTLLAALWLRRQSSLTLLKEGAL